MIVFNKHSSEHDLFKSCIENRDFTWRVEVYKDFRLKEIPDSELTVYYLFLFPVSGVDLSEASQYWNRM
jgi:hypothetical protein